MKKWVPCLLVVILGHCLVFIAIEVILNNDEALPFLAYNQNKSYGDRYKVNIINESTLAPNASSKSNKEKKIPQKNMDRQHQNFAGATSVPQIIGKLSPPYPRASRLRGEQGSVTLRFRLNNEGTIISIEVIKSSGYKRLDKSALSYLKGQRFTLGQPNSIAPKRPQELTISYRIE